ncbi:hypothetical protein M3J09_005533 [Ascochyta lentis]
MHTMTQTAQHRHQHSVYVTRAPITLHNQVSTALIPCLGPTSP